MARLTPRDIQEKEFATGFRGYKEEEVDEFLDAITESYEAVFKENIDLKEDVERLAEQCKKYEIIGERMQAALVAAQETADDVRKNANKEAENIIREAELKAQKLVQGSKDQHRELQKSLAALKQVEEEFRFKLKSMLQSYLKLLEEIAFGDRKEVKELILPEDLAALDERKREVGQRETAAKQQPKAPAVVVGQEVVSEAPVKEPEPGVTAAEAGKASKAETKPEEKVAKAEEKPAETAAKPEAAVKPAPAMPAPSKPAPSTVEGVEEPKVEAKPATADDEMKKTINEELLAIQQAVQESPAPKAAPEAPEEAEPEAKPAAEKAEAAKKPEEPKPAEAKAKEAPSKAGEDLEIVEDESFWKDI